MLKNVMNKVKNYTYSV